MSMSVSARRIPFLAAAILLSAAIMMSSLFVGAAYASGGITQRSLTLQDDTVGGSAPSDGNAAHTVNHFFDFIIPQNVGTIKSIVFHYCTSASDATSVSDIDAGGSCTTPTGLHTDATSSTTLDQTTNGATGFSFDSLVNTNVSGPGSNGEPYMTSATGLNTTSGPTTIKATLDHVMNPDGTDCGGSFVNCTFYVAILAYDGADGTGTLLTSGTVAASVNQQIQLSGTMPESLIFCTGATVATTGTAPNTIPDCSSATSGSITFNKLFSPTSTAYATSQMAASTNALHGYAITVSGDSLTNGSNHIPGIGGTAATDTSTVGQNEFGLNLVADTNANASTPALTTASADINPAAAAPNYYGAASANFDTADSYAFADSDSSLTLNDVAASDSGSPGTAMPTNGQVFTVTYMANVAANLPAGQYATTLTYICTPTF